MKRNASHSRSGIFLMEIIVAICFFSLVSAVCLQVFVRAKQYGEATTNLNMALAQTSSVAETARSIRDPEAAKQMLDGLYPYGQASADGYVIFYDENWDACEADDAVYEVQAEYMTTDEGDEAKGMTIWTITARATTEAAADSVNGDEIYRLEVEVCDDAQ